MDNYDYHTHTNSKGSQGSKISHWGSHLGHISGYDEFHSLFKQSKTEISQYNLMLSGNCMT